MSSSRILAYATKVSRESVRIALTLAALNDLEVKISDIQNAYLTAPCSERYILHLGQSLEKTAWAIIPSKYVNDAVNNCEKWIQENMPEHKHSCRASNFYLDTTAELDEEQTTYYQSQISTLHWIVELGRIDIATDTSLVASHIALPRRDTYRLYFIYAYLNKRQNS